MSKNKQIDSDKQVKETDSNSQMPDGITNDDIIVSFGKKINGKGGNVVSPMTLTIALERIRSGKSAETIVELSKTESVEKRREIKEKLPYTLFAGEFSSRAIANLIKSSGMAIVDIDYEENAHILKEQIFDDKDYIVASWISPSGKGLKLLVRIPIVDNDHQYKEYYAAILEDLKEFTPKADTSTKDISRACFESYDMDILIRDYSETVEFAKRIETKEYSKDFGSYIADDSEVTLLDLADINLDNKREFAALVKGLGEMPAEGRHGYLFRLTKDCLRSGIPKNEAISLMHDSYQGHSNDIKDFWSYIKRTWKEQSKIVEFGSKRITEIISNAEQKLFSSANGQPIKFWYEDKNGKYKFLLDGAIEYLESIGISRHYVADGLVYVYVRVVDNVASLIDIASIKQLVLAYIKSFKIRRLYSASHYFVKIHVTESGLQNVRRKDITVFRGERDTVYLFYSDCILAVTKESIGVVQYPDFSHTIWKRSIMERKAPRKKLKNGVYQQFFTKIFGPTSNGLLFAERVIGYALQRYRNLANIRAIVLNDSGISEDAMGGTGKGLIYQALKEFMPSVKENGKAFRADRQFSFQNVDIDTQLCFIDDVTPAFDFTQMFSVITDGFHIERKHKQPIWISAEDAPLFLVSSNYGVKGNNDSHKRRRYDIGLDKVYGPNFTPETEFGHQFFREWDRMPDEWIKFDNFMIKCIQKYLSVGVLASWENPALAAKQLKADTYQGFFEIAEGYKLLKDYPKDQNLEEVRRELGYYKLSGHMLTKWNKKYAKSVGLIYDDSKRTSFMLREP